MAMAAFIKENIQLGMAYSFRGLVYDHHGVMQRVGRHAAGEGAGSSSSCSIGSKSLCATLGVGVSKTSKPASTVTYFL